jgi:hypothetical protein
VVSEEASTGARVSQGVRRGKLEAGRQKPASSLIRAWFEPGFDSVSESDLRATGHKQFKRHSRPDWQSSKQRWVERVAEHQFKRWLERHSTRCRATPAQASKAETASKHPWCVTELKTLLNQGTGSRPDSFFVCTTLETPPVRDYLEPPQTPTRDRSGTWTACKLLRGGAQGC